MSVFTNSEFIETLRATEGLQRSLSTLHPLRGQLFDHIHENNGTASSLFWTNTQLEEGDIRQDYHRFGYGILCATQYIVLNTKYGSDPRVCIAARSLFGVAPQNTPVKNLHLYSMACLDAIFQSPDYLPQSLARVVSGEIGEDRQYFVKYGFFNLKEQIAMNVERNFVLNSTATLISAIELFETLRFRERFKKLNLNLALDEVKNIVDFRKLLRETP